MKVVLALEDAFVLIASRPGIGHSREDLTERSLKFWSVDSYLVVYDPANDPLTIIAVLQGSRAGNPYSPLHTYPKVASLRCADEPGAEIVQLKCL